MTGDVNLLLSNMPNFLTLGTEYDCLSNAQRLDGRFIEKIVTTKDANKKERHKSAQQTAAEDKQIMKKLFPVHSPKVDVLVNGVSISGTMDTGAECSLLRTEIFFRHWTKADLCPLPSHLNRFTGVIGDLPIKGFFITNIKIGDSVYHDKLILVGDLKNNSELLVDMNIIQDLENDLEAIFCSH